MTVVYKSILPKGRTGRHGPMTRQRCVLIFVALALVTAGCGSATTSIGTQPSTTAPANPTAAEEAATHRATEAGHAREAREETTAHTKAVAEAKRKAKVRAWGEEQVRKLHQEEHEGKQPEAPTAAQQRHEEAEYNRRNAEGERRLKEMVRRAHGESTPEEQKNSEARKREASQEAEAIREGERLKAEGK
jgi:hypothetical protein